MSLSSARHRSLALLLCLALATPAWAPPAGPPPPESPTLPRHLQDGALDDRRPTQGAAGLHGPAVTESNSPFSRIVFQSYRDNNWEIYAADDDGSNLLRLTNNGAADTQPRFTHGADRVAFTSDRAGRPEIFVMSATGAGVSQLTSNAGGDVSPAWSPDGARIAFQSYLDGQAEVYVMQANGLNQTRLTNSPGFDGQPVWSPDGSQLAFTAYRNGQWRIWVMDANGANQTQVSTQPYSEDPAWSPDGTHLFYDADTDGNGFTELWMSDANGANAHLMFNPGYAADALAGSWAPNGNYVAFTQVWYIQSGGQWYWTNADICQAGADISGGGGYIGCVIGNTEWNPDWQTTDGSPPVSSMAALPAASPANFTVHWSGSDIGSGLLGFDVQRRTGPGGAWTGWLTATTDTSAVASGLGGVSYYFRARARDLAGNLEAWPADFDAMTTVESLPPHSSMTALPLFTPGAFTLSWGGFDPGGSGIQYYAVQYHTDVNPAWTDLFAQTIDTSFIYSNFFTGRAYYFRVRAVDLAGNVEAWRAGADTHTTVYGWSTTGTASDNHGTPIGGAHNSLSPSPLFAGPSDLDGNFAVYGAQADSPPVYTATWSKAGYGSLPAGTVSGSGNASPFVVVLPPADNVVANSGFETGALGAGGWQSVGDLPASITSTLRHTGQYAGLVGGPGLLTAPEILSTSVLVNNLKLVQSSDSVLHAAWTTTYPDNAVHYTTRLPGGDWSAQTVISDSISAGGGLGLAADGAGNVHVMWVSAGNQVMYRHRAPNGVWDPPVALTPADNVNGFQAVDLAVDGGGAAHALWLHTGTAVSYRYRAAGGAWSSTETVATGPAFGPHLAVNAAGVANVVWNQADALHLRRRVAGVWAAPLLIAGSTGAGPVVLGLTAAGEPHLVWTSAGPALNYTRCPGGLCLPAPEVISVTGASQVQLAAASDGAVHLAWLGYDTTAIVQYARRAPNGAWEAVTTVDPGSSNTYSPYSALSMAVGPDGVAHLAWGVFPYPANVSYAERSASGAWSGAEAVAFGGVYSLLLVADQNSGGVHLLSNAFQSLQPAYLAYQGPILASQAGPSALAQPVTIPPTMTVPTLSFLYETGGLSAARPFTVSVDAGSGPVTVFSTTARAGSWTHAWADLSAWAGQTVTVTFSVAPADGQQTTFAYVDEVSLGAAHPDNWVSLAGTGEAVGQGLVQYIVRYGNRGAAPASGLTLTVQLDPHLQWVSSFPPAGAGPLPTWNIGSVPVGGGGVITITARVQSNVTLLNWLTSTAHLGANGELETLNNTAVVLTQIIGRLFLPMVLTN